MFQRLFFTWHVPETSFPHDLEGYELITHVGSLYTEESKHISTYIRIHIKINAKFVCKFKRFLRKETPILNISDVQVQIIIILSF